ncbi:MAG TPA: DoxX family protein [Myxococcales bacterium]|nr:DoxX family protein [Myxococcales bacterium]
MARLFLVCIFVQGALGKITGWSGQAEYMSRHGLHFVQPLLAAALVIETLGALCLLLGIWTRTAAGILCVYLLAVSVMLHDFWAVQNGGQLQTHFFKNLGICGGLLMVAAFGPGRWALREVR